MPSPSFTQTLLVDQSPETAFQAILNIRGWWSEDVQGPTDVLGAEFTYRYQDVHRFRAELVEMEPNRRVAWLVKENHFSFTQDKTEWVGTQLVFDLSEEGGQTRIVFTHEGLVPEYECFEVCRDAWTHYIQDSLRGLIETGQGQPNPVEGGYNHELAMQHGIE